MELSAEKIGDVLVVTVPGNHLDASVADDFKQALGPLLEGCPKVVLDMKGLRFVDSAGIGSILSCLRRLSACDGDLKLCGVSAPVRSSFEIARMHRIIDIFDTCEEALAAFAPEPG